MFWECVVDVIASDENVNDAAFGGGIDDVITFDKDDVIDGLVCDNDTLTKDDGVETNVFVLPIEEWFVETTTVDVVFDVDVDNESTDEIDVGIEDSLVDVT